MDNLETLRQVLHADGQSLTTPRRAVFAALRGREPLTMNELVARCAGTDRASVYRTVALFERLGVIQRLHTGWKYKLELTDAYHEHHHHATCLHCGRSYVIPEDKVIERYLARAAEALQFKLERHQLELQGYCADCAKNQR